MRKNHPLLIGIENVTPYKTVLGHSLYSIRPPAMQIQDFLPVGGVMGMTSYPGVGKTWLAMEITRAISSGKPFLDRYKTMRGGVLFVGSDSSLYDYARQWTRLTRATPDAEEVYEPVRFLIQSSFMFEDRDEIRKLIRTHQMFEWGETHDTAKGPVRERGFHTIVCDTVSRLTRANQNDNTEMEEVFRNIRWLSEATDAAVVLLHHNGKKSEFNDGSDWRGAMSQIGALDSWIQLVPHKKDKNLIGVQYKKFRGITPQDFAYRMHVDDPTVASLVASDEAVTSEQKLTKDVVAEAIIEHVRLHPGTRVKTLVDGLWPKFNVGVADLAGHVYSFETRAKLLMAVHNRLNKLIHTKKLVRATDTEGKAIYTVEGAKVKKVKNAKTKTPDSDQKRTGVRRADKVAKVSKVRKRNTKVGQA